MNSAVDCNTIHNQVGRKFLYVVKINKNILLELKFVRMSALKI